MSYAFGNAQHIGLRKQQQDAFAFSDPNDAAFLAHGGFAVILADGMGGMEHGDVASRSAAKAFLSAYEAKRPEESIGSALDRALLAANTAVCDLIRQFRTTEIGTTLIAAVIHGNQLEWISAGDSAIFIYREGEFILLTASHTYARELDDKVAQGLLSREAALAHPERESLTSYVGMPKLRHIDRNARPFAMGDDDCVLLASDGLFKTLSEPEMAGAMRGTLQQRCEALVATTIAKEREHQDNVTTVAVAIREQLALAEFVPYVADHPAPTLPPLSARIPARSGKLLWLMMLLVLTTGLGSYFWHLHQIPQPAPPRPRVETGSKRYELDKLPPTGPRDKPVEPSPIDPREAK